MKKILGYLMFALMVGAACAQSNLPTCLGSDASKWTNCFGSFTTAKGRKYVGEFMAGKFNGAGTYTFPEGDKYVGEFKDTKFNGQGVYTYASGDKYVGGWKDDKYSGQGTYTSPSGYKYVGEWKDGDPNGQGTYTFANGDKYVGEFKDGNQNGQGTYFRSDGSVGQGEWRNNKPHGRFIEYKADKSIDRSGIFKDGKLITAKYIDQNSFSELIPKVEVNQLSAVVDKKESLLDTNQAILAPILEKRIALVIGNGAYTVRPLNNPVNDANDISAALKRSGFLVIDVRNANLTQMRAKIREFGDQLINSDVGLVYYSGHGVELKGRNYLIPVNADIQREDEIADQGLDAGLILEKMNTAGKGVNILVVDACRDDPFGRSFRSTGRGLAQMDAPKGTIIAYSTSPGKVASDGDPKERNSPYTKHLLRAMQIPNIPIEQVFKEVRRSVQAETKNQQTPWENTSLSGDFYFRVQK